MLWKLIQPALYKILGYKKAVAMADVIGKMSGRDAFAYTANLLDVQPVTNGLSHVPKTGAVIIIANHPTGLADGSFVYQTLAAHRPDHIYMANADALRVIPDAADIIIPVEWVKEKRTPAKTRATLAALKQAIKDEKAVVIFPSGVLAKMTLRGLVDKDWNPTAVSVARKHNTPIAPLHIKSRNSWLYYFLCNVNDELRDITLFHELLNKKGAKPIMTFGPVIDPATLPKGSAEATAKVRETVEALGT